MDPLSASCYTLNGYEELSSQILAQRKTDEKYLQVLGSTVSIGNYEKKNFKNLMPQILAAVIATSNHISLGISLAYSAILIPQLAENPEFEVSKSEASWIVSIVALTTPVGSLIVGPMMDHFGRLQTLAMSSVPAIGGCVIMALSQNVTMLIVGRALVGFSSALASSPAVVYLTEIARKDMRGSLISFAPALASLGMVLTFILGWFMNWRQVAWATNIFVIIPSVLVFFVPESPAWLVSKDQIEKARQSLVWINKYQPQPENKDVSIAELQLALLQKEHELRTIEVSRRSENELSAKIHEFMKPTGYKPMLLLIGLFTLQQFSGIFIFLFYSIIFFQDVGTTMNPYLTSIFIGVTRFVMSMINTYVQGAFGRRTLMMLSCFAMSTTIFLSGLFSYWIQNGTTTLTWVPVVFLLLFVVASMIGVIPVPYTMSAELFPLEIRGVAQSVSICIANFLMFFALQLHPVLHEFFGGICGEQYFFAVVSLVAVIFVYIFMPETQGMRLTEIEEYFRNNVVYMGSNEKKDETRPVSGANRRTTVKNQVEHEKHLLEKV